MAWRLLLVHVLLALSTVVNATASMNNSEVTPIPSGSGGGSPTDDTTNMLMPTTSFSSSSDMPTTSPTVISPSNESSSGDNSSSITQMPSSITPTTTSPETTPTATTVVSSAIFSTPASASIASTRIATTVGSSARPSTPASTSVVPTPNTTAMASPTPSLDSSTSLALALGIAVGVGGAVFLCLFVVAAVLCFCYIQLGKHKKIMPDGRFLGQSHNDLLAFPMSEPSSTSQDNSDDMDGMVLGKNSAVPNFSDKNIYAHLTGKNLSVVSLEELAGHVAGLHENNDELADQEYMDLKLLDPRASTRSASLHCNELRNRYINILANEATRVVLSAVHKRPGSDYINANYIDGYSDKVEYIAAQGPLPNTVVDFWRMIWEKEVRIIVMVTNLVENGMEKSHEYWPSRGTIQYGQVVVTLSSQKLFPEFVKRTFAVSFATNNSKADIVPQTIVQYHFTVWPDFGVPQHASAMLKFVRRVRKNIKPDHGPVVVHCSAGVGRSGTFIAIDVMLQKMEAGEPLNIMEFVCKMRAQRNNMVQTSAQYLFIYDALLHSHLFGNTEVVKASLSDRVKALSEALSEDTPETTQLDKEFELVISDKFVVEEQSVALADFNADKNRSTSKIPFDHNRVVLEKMDAPPGHDYINASFINGYYNRHEFIATQHPLPSTVASYWKMITEREVYTIVTIGPVEDKDMFWPEEGTKDYEGTTVEVIFTDVNKESGITIREMEVECSETEKSLTVKHFHLTGYPTDDETPASPGEMLHLVHCSREHWRGSGFTLTAINTSPSVLNEAAGIYCALCVLLRQLEVEGCVDLVTTVQQLRRQRLGIFTAKRDFKLLYDILVKVCSD